MIVDAGLGAPSQFASAKSRGEFAACIGINLLASERGVTAIEVKDDKLMLTRNNDFIMLGGKFPRLTKKDAKARVKEIKRLLLSL